MRGRSLVALAILAALAALAAMWLDRDPRPEPGSEIGGLLYPDLTASINDISRIELSFDEPTEAVTMERADERWQVTDKWGYRADAGAIRQLLLQLSEARILELKTSNPDFYPRLGVEEIGDGGTSPGVVVNLYGPTSPVSLIIGNRETRAGNGAYVRRSGEARSYLVDAELDPGGDITDWLDDEIIDVDAESVRTVTIRHADGDSLRLLGVEGRLALAELPPGRDMSSAAATDPIARGLDNMRLEDVMPDREFGGSEPDAVITYLLSDDRRFTLRAWQREADRYVSVDVDLEPASDEPPAAEMTGIEDTDPDPDGQRETDETATLRADEETVARLDARLAGWVYKISAQKYDQIVRHTEDLLKPVAEDSSDGS